MRQTKVSIGNAVLSSRIERSFADQLELTSDDVKVIEEINSAARGSVAGQGDVLGEVVKVLNEQLVSLGWIDEVSSRVEERVGKLEREVRGVNEGFGG